MRLARILFVLALTCGGLTSIPGMGRAVTPRCFGRDATIIGTPGADVLTGTRRDDVIVGRGGGDRILGRSGNDRICGGDGADHVRGGGLTDWIDGGHGSDTLLGDSGRDALQGGYGADTMRGGVGNDFIDIPNALTLRGRAGGIVRSSFGSHSVGAGNDWASGGEGRDWMKGRGNDILHGGADHDELEQGRAGSSVFFGGSGDDLIDVRGVDPARLLGGAGDDEVAGGRGDDVLRGGDGDDSVDGRKGNDSLDGGLGFDEVSFGNPFYAPKAVQVNLQTGIATGWGTDSLSAIEEIWGTAESDELIGDAGPNVFHGMLGDDTLTGGGGTDKISFRWSEALVTVDLGLGTAVGEGSDTLAEIEDVTGTQYNDVIIGDGLANGLIGGFGRDLISGLDGDDVLDGGGQRDIGDGGPDVNGDVCISIEQKTNCELP